MGTCASETVIGLTPKTLWRSSHVLSKPQQIPEEGRFSTGMLIVHLDERKLVFRTSFENVFPKFLPIY